MKNKYILINDNINKRPTQSFKHLRACEKRAVSSRNEPHTHTQPLFTVKVYDTIFTILYTAKAT